MTALTQEVDLAVTGGELRRLPAEISANPFAGSLLSFAADGYVHELVAGEPFAGICRTSIPTAAAAIADGAAFIEASAGLLVIEAVISGVGQDDAALRRKVFASDDATLTFTPTGNTFIGDVIGVDGARAIILARTADQVQGTLAGIMVLADSDQTLAAKHLDKLLLITPGAGRTLTLPPAADCAGRTLTVKTLAAQVVTLDGNASENIEGATTFTALDAANDVASFLCDGTAWHLAGGRIA